MRWRDVLSLRPEWAQFTNWPVIPTEHVPSQHRARFERNRAMVATILSGQSLASVAKTFGFTSGYLSQLLQRALVTEGDSDPPLTRALIPYQTIKPIERIAPLPTLARPSGHRGALKVLFNQLPALKLRLDTWLVDHLRQHRDTVRVSPALFHGVFKQYLINQNWPQDTYPFTTNDLAYESLRRYLKAQICAFHAVKQYLVSYQAHLAIATDHGFGRIQIDEHVTDLHASLDIEWQGVHSTLRLDRVALLIAIDVSTRCIIGYHLTACRTPNQADVLQLLENCLRPWEPPALSTPGLQFDPGARFPSGPDAPAIVQTVQLDNAWCHHAGSIARFVCEQLGGALHFGRPYLPKVRNWVEACFHLINQQLTHHLPSTTGSSPFDPNREPRRHQQHPPLVTITQFEEALAVLITRYNLTPQANLNNTSPIECYEHLRATQWTGFVMQAALAQMRAFVTRQSVVVHQRKDTHERYIHCLYTKYRGSALSRLTATDQTAFIEWDRRDVRTVTLLSPNGVELGVLSAPKTWQKFPHSYATRQHIMRDLRKHKRHTSDPLGDYFLGLIERRELPRDALKLLRLSREMGGEQVIEACIMASPDQPPRVSRPSLSRQGIQWSPQSAFRGGNTP